MKNKMLCLCILLLVIENLIFFWPGNLFFLNDDLLHIPLTDQGHWFQTNSVRPIHELLVRLDLFLWGKKAFGFHTTALLLHFIVCLQLYDLCTIIQVRWLDIAKPQAKTGALLAVILFLVTPQFSESIAWILGRTPVLSAVFLLVTVRLFFKADAKVSDYVAGAFFFAATLFTYEQSFLLPLALLFIAIFEKEKLKRRVQVTYIWLLGAVDFVYIIVRKIMTSELIGSYEADNLIKFNWLTLAANYFRIVIRLFINPGNKTAVIVSAVVIMVVTSSVIFIVKRNQVNVKAVVFFVASIVLLIVPVVSLGVAVNSFESGRYLYIPSIFLMAGFGIAVASLGKENGRRNFQVISFLIFLVVYWTAGKFSASKHYKSASRYAENTGGKVSEHFKNSSDTLFIDTLNVSVHRLPVFRLGFKTGMSWLYNHVDTNKILVLRYYDENNKLP